MENLVKTARFLRVAEYWSGAEQRSAPAVIVLETSTYVCFHGAHSQGPGTGVGVFGCIESQIPLRYESFCRKVLLHKLPTQGLWRW
jgi:hypothetical protein